MIYTITHRHKLLPNEYFDLLSYAFHSLESAQDFVNGRTGKINSWIEHNSHGHCWITIDDEYIIDELELK